MRPHPLRHREMFDWAWSHLVPLSAEVDEYFARDPFLLWGDVDPATDERRVRVRVKNVVQVPNLELRVGDIVHNLCVSLDYIAFAIAQKHNAVVAAGISTIAFPICEHQKDWGSVAGKLRAWCPPEAIAEFEKLQPYNTEWSNWHPILLLRALDNPHKHRTRLAAAPNITNIDFHEDGKTGVYEMSWMGVEPEFGDGAIIARMKYLGGDSPEERGRMGVTAGFDIQFDENGPAAGHSVRDLLRLAANYIHQIVFPTFEQFIVPQPQGGGAR